MQVLTGVHIDVLMFRNINNAFNSSNFVDILIKIFQIFYSKLF